MANETEDKRLEKWKIAAKKYGELLEEMVEELRGKSEAVPAARILKDLAKKSIEIEHASKSFRYAVDRAVKSTPQPPQPPSEYELTAQKILNSLAKSPKG